MTYCSEQHTHAVLKTLTITKLNENIMISRSLFGNISIHLSRLSKRVLPAVLYADVHDVITTKPNLITLLRLINNNLGNLKSFASP